MNKDVYDIGTMLYDFGMNRIGWVVGKHHWRDLHESLHNDWDVEWVNNDRYFIHANELLDYIQDYKEYLLNEP
jgi:hypothetical protein